MSKLELLRDLEAEREKLEKKINSMKEQYKSLADFVEEVSTSAAAKGLKLRDVALALAPELDPEGRSSKTKATTGTRSPRKVKTYRNPHDGSEIQTKGGNHKILKEWKTKYGADVVEGWVVAA